MNYCTIRLGSKSINEIELIDSKIGLQNPRIEIVLKCKQVPSEVDADTFCFIWLGSDNNKGIPTKWDQGLRAFGKVIKKIGGPNYNDIWYINISIGVIFPKSLKQQDFIKNLGEEYLSISGIPVIGLNTYSNQTVQLIRNEEPEQDIRKLFFSISNLLDGTVDQILEAYPDTQVEDVENEHDNYETNAYRRSFDSTKINIDTKTPSLDTLIERIQYNEIDLNTESYFQRKDNLWDEGKQSRLIESILIQFPLPAFYFDGTNNKKWLVVDGLQRLSSIRNFIVKKTLKLRDLEFLTNLNGLGYEDLERDLQRLIKSTQVITYIIMPGTPTDVKFNIFKRINTGGLILVPQEIRHALFQGAPAKFVAELANCDEFISVTGGSIKTDRMLDRDYANRFLAFYILGYENYEPDLDTFMSKAMASVYEMTDLEKIEIKNRFIKSMKLNKEVFGKHAFRKFKNVNDERSPINKSLFDVFSVSFAKISDIESKNIKNRKVEFIQKFIHLLNDITNDAFFWAITSSTSDKNRVRYRFSKIDELINNFK